jgi:hypothetical protein
LIRTRAAPEKKVCAGSIESSSEYDSGVTPAGSLPLGVASGAKTGGAGTPLGAGGPTGSEGGHATADSETRARSDTARARRDMGARD